MQKVGFSKKALVAAITAVTMVSGNAAMAAVDAGFQPAVDGIVSDVTTYIGIAALAALGLTAIVLGWDTGLALIKKFTKKGAS